MDIAISKNGIPIRLTIERWMHISIGHPEMADYYFEILETIQNPEIIYEGNLNAEIAVKNFQKTLTKFVVVIYSELNVNDGFVLTAYFTNKLQVFNKKKIIWKQ